jgi:hypothetical protein
MLTNTDKEIKKGFIIPFTTPTARRLKDFTKNMEMAAILYLAESERKKGESRVLGKTDEKLVFVAKACYPIWLIPYRGATLIFDGLGLASHTLSYDTIPDIETFNKNLWENRQTTESYTATLIRNMEYFKNFNGKEEIKIEGLISNHDLKEDFKTYLYKMKKVKKHLTNKVVLTAIIEDLEIKDGIGQLSNIRKRTAKDIETIDTSIKLLNTITRRKIKTIRIEIRKTQKKHRKQIEKTKRKMKKKIGQIQSKYNKKIARKSKKFKEKLQRLHKNQIKLQKTLKYLRTEAKRCRTKMHSKKRDKKTQLNLKLKRIQKKLPTLNKKIKANSKRSRKVKTSMKLEIAQQKAECDEHIVTANKIFLDLQASRDAEITMKRRQLATLEKLTSLITNSMWEMVKAKRAFLKEFDIITITGKNRPRGMVYLPFYVARYEKGDKKRYTIYPPTLVRDMGILTKMKGALGATKLKALLQSRSKAIATFLNQLVPQIEKNTMLEKNITEAGIQASILLSKRLRVGVKKGLIELEKQNWLSRNELQTFSKILYIYTNAT